MKICCDDEMVEHFHNIQQHHDEKQWESTKMKKIKKASKMTFTFFLGYNIHKKQHVLIFQVHIPHTGFLHKMEHFIVSTFSNFTLDAYDMVKEQFHHEYELKELVVLLVSQTSANFNIKLCLLILVTSWYKIQP